MIQAKESTVQITRSGIISSFFIAVPEKGAAATKELNLPVFIDFDISKSNDSKKFQIFLTVQSNTDQKKPGYAFEITLLGDFKVDEDDPDKRGKLVLYSALPSLINHARTILTTLSSQSMHGPYVMPMIDVQQLINDSKEKPTKAKKIRKKSEA